MAHEHCIEFYSEMLSQYESRRDEMGAWWANYYARKLANYR
jgi:hypothetical protein